MKRYLALFGCVFALTACGSGTGSDDSGSSAASEGSANAENQSANDAGDFDSPEARRSYALGMDIGNSLKELPVQIQVDSLADGVRDVVNGDETRLTQQELEGVMQSFVQEMESAQQRASQEQAQSNASEGEQFLAENANKEGIQTTDSGLQYRVVEQGNGPSPDANDSVTVHYTGRLIDGTVFDSSRERGEPVTFPVDAVIPGWTEALQLMQEGARYELFIPADLAYGERGAGAQIGPNETLVFDVELLEVEQNDGGQSSNTSGNGSSASGSNSNGNGQTSSSSESAGSSGDSMSQ